MLPSPFPSDAIDLVTHELVLKKIMNKIRPTSQKDSPSLLQGLTIQPIFIFVKIMKMAAICFRRIEFMPKISTAFCLYLSKLSKIKKMFDRQSLVNVTLKTRTKFHSNRLFRLILHIVSKNLVSRKTRLKFQNVIFHMYPSLTFFYLYISRLTVPTIHN